MGHCALGWRASAGGAGGPAPAAVGRWSAQASSASSPWAAAEVVAVQLQLIGELQLSAPCKQAAAAPAPAAEEPKWVRGVQRGGAQGNLFSMAFQVGGCQLPLQSGAAGMRMSLSLSRSPCTPRPASHRRRRRCAPQPPPQPPPQIKGKRHALSLRCAQAEAAVAFDLAAFWAAAAKGHRPEGCSRYNFAPAAWYPRPLLDGLLALPDWAALKARLGQLQAEGALAALVPFGGAGRRYAAVPQEACWRGERRLELCVNVRGVHLFRRSRQVPGLAAAQPQPAWLGAAAAAAVPPLMPLLLCLLQTPPALPRPAAAGRACPWQTCRALGPPGPACSSPTRRLLGTGRDCPAVHAIDTAECNPRGMPARLTRCSALHLPLQAGPAQQRHHHNIPLRHGSRCGRSM